MFFRTLSRADTGSDSGLADPPSATDLASTVPRGVRGSAAMSFRTPSRAGTGSSRGSSVSQFLSRISAMSLPFSTSGSYTRGTSSYTGTGSESVSGSQILDHVDTDLLRGVPVHRVLSHLGAVWSTSMSTTAEDLAMDFALSEQVCRIDDFISHDWLTGRWVKLLALCHAYRLPNTLLVNLVSSSALLLLMISGGLPRPPLTKWHTTYAGGTYDIHKPIFFLPLGLVVFWVSFFFGPARSINGCRARVVFVDKVCISQTDAQKKRRGILSLAGFLQSSNRLVMLWTPRYFTRLWCVFELATWLRIAGHHNFDRTVAFMPVSRSQFFCVVHLAFFAYYVLLSLALALGTSAGVANLPCAILIHSVALLAYRRFVKDFVTLVQQLQDFSIRESACFCCTHNHRHPVSGARLPCDRELIYAALKEWFSDTVEHDGVLETQEQVLDYFNALVRVKLQSLIVSNFGMVRLSYMDAVFVILPGILMEFDMMCMVGAPAEVEVRSFLYSFTMCFFFLPSSMKLWMGFLCRSTHIGFRFEHVVGPLAQLVVLVPVQILASVALFGPVWYAGAATSAVPIWCALVLWGVVTVWLFKPRRPGRITGDTREDLSERSQLELWTTSSERCSERISVTSAPCIDACRIGAVHWDSDADVIAL